MPAPFLIAPMLVSLSLVTTPVTDNRLPDPAAATEIEALVLEGREAPAETPVETLADDLADDLPVVEQPLAGISVDLECLVYPDGYVADCAVVSETRPGLGFGEAAVALMNGSSMGSAAASDRSTPVKFMHTIEFTPD